MLQIALCASADLSTILEKIYFPRQTKIRKDKTRVHYRCAIRNLEEMLGRKAFIDDLTDDNVLVLIHHLRERRLAEKTVSERRGRINALWKWLAEKGQVTRWPTVAALKVPKRVPRAWTKEELAKLITACHQEIKPVGRIPGGIWWAALHALLWDTGQRITAILAARWEDLSGEWLTLPAEYVKGGAADAIYRLHPNTVELIKSSLAGKRDMLLPWPFDMGTLYNRYEVILKRAGLPHTHKDKFHKMRRSMASHFEAAGGNATIALRHASRTTTIESYLDPSIVGQDDPMMRLFRMGDMAG